MAGGNSAGKDVKKVEVGGVEVAVNLDYMRSWNGIRQAARMQSDDLTDAEQLVEMVAYYEAAIANMDEVSAAKGDENVQDFVSFLSEAVQAANPKN